MGILIYKRNVWPEVYAEQRPRYMALNDFTVSLEIEDGAGADALDQDPLLHAELIDKVNEWVNGNTVRLLSDYVYRHETAVVMKINNRDFEGLAKEYKDFGVFVRYLLAVTNDNIKRLVGTVIQARAKSQRDRSLYLVKFGVKLGFNVAGIGVSGVALTAGSVSLVTAFTPVAIPGLLVGGAALLQSLCELARELWKAIETMEQAANDARQSLEKLVEGYRHSNTVDLVAREFAVGAANKVFAGFVDFRTIPTVSNKVQLWGNKILGVEQQTHKLARQIPEVMRKIVEIERAIMLAQRLPVPSREGIGLKVPPPIPSRAGRPHHHLQQPSPPPIPSRTGRVAGVAYKDMFALKPPPVVPSTLGRVPGAVYKEQFGKQGPQAESVPSAAKQGPDAAASTNAKLSQLRVKLARLTTRISDLQGKVVVQKKDHERYNKALAILGSERPTALLYAEALRDLGIDVAKAGINLAVGSVDLAMGVGTVRETIHSLSVNLRLD